ncbi:MAG: hypothetical protein Kow00105_07500 [Phycisphaeraceae bacterium]
MRTLVSGLIFGSMILLGLPANAEDGHEALAALKQENATLRAELERIKSAYRTLELEAEQLRAELARLKSSHEDLEVQTRELSELAGITLSGERIESAEARFRTTFDEQTGRTTVRTGIEELKVLIGSAADHRLSLAYSYDGQVMRQPPQVVSLFIQAFYSGGVYRKQDVALFNIDGDIVEVPITDYQVKSRRMTVAGKRSIRKDDETLVIHLDAELLRRLARAIQVKIQVGTVHLELTRDQTALFRAIKRRIELGA